MFQPANDASSAALSFRAGKMNLEGGMVKADPRPGTLSIVGDASFIHVKWRTRPRHGQGTVEDDWMVFPDEATFKRVEKCKTGRVYVLQFKGSGERFFWMQEPSEEKDDEYCKLINQYIQDPTKARSAAARQGGAAGAAAGGGAGGGRNNIDLATLRNILQGLGGEGAGAPPTQPQGGAAAATQAASAQQQQQQQRHVDVQLTDLFAQDSVRQVLSGDPSSFEERLSEHFPEGIETSVLEEIRTPQFRQSLDLLQAALSDPNARQELTQAFGLPASNDPTTGGVQQFLRSVLAWHEQQKNKN